MTFVAPNPDFKVAVFFEGENLKYQVFVLVTKFLQNTVGNHKQFCSSLRKDCVANYGSIWIQFPLSVTGLLQRSKRFEVSSVLGATIFANLRRKFSKT